MSKKHKKKKQGRPQSPQDQHSPKVEQKLRQYMQELYTRSPLSGETAQQEITMKELSEKAIKIRDDLERLISTDNQDKILDYIKFCYIVENHCAIPYDSSGHVLFKFFVKGAYRIEISTYDRMVIYGVDNGQKLGYPISSQLANFLKMIGGMVCYLGTLVESDRWKKRMGLEEGENDNFAKVSDMTII